MLATTSIGQEGPDFHQYCHAVVHWNLPANPVDLEQLEFHVLLAEFSFLFTDEERVIARTRLEEYGFDVERRLRQAAGDDELPT